MAVLCVIPARGGSKGILRKNLRRVGGLTLVERAIAAAQAASRVETVVVTTDDDEIASVARRSGAEVVLRPPDLATDTATSESALAHAVRSTLGDPGADDVLVFLQCTSPLIAPGDIDRAVTMVTEGGYDSVFSAVPSHSFLWRVEEGAAAGINHEWRVRERRQDRPAEFRETGAIYVMRLDRFLEAGHRFFGRVGICVVPDAHGIDIDAEADLDLARFVAGGADPGPLDALDPSRVAALVTDFDGVHTDNRATVGEDGNEAVRVDRSDGLGLSHLRSAGLPLLILSKERNPVVGARAAKLGVECLQGVDDKLGVLREWAGRNGIDLADVVYVGNDSNDLACLDAVGWPVVVADAHPSVRTTGAMVTRRRGGAGALREIADRLLGGPGPFGWHRID